MNQQVEELFHELADLSYADRETYFRERRVSPEVREQVEGLLRFDEVSDDSLSASVAGFAQELLAADEAEKEDTRCGPYRLVRVIGRGGMGSVYLAERADGEVEQRVAIKFLRTTREETGFHDRFLRERQILATLRHPGIASLLDAGHTTDGRPYLAMDYIDGEPIDTYAERLGLREKLALFIKVCEAVSYAHQNLVVHRDLKPSNILVTAEGEPKLLDFGIAKLLEEEGSPEDATMLTREGGWALTPAYAAPEQVNGGRVTTATDVYGLGVLFFVMLSGRHPAGEGPHTYSDLIKAVMEKDPPRLSDVGDARGRAVGRRKLGHVFRGDLDTIAAKALKKNPRERYTSAAGMADDLRRYLRHEPISARPDTLAYRAEKFVLRHRAAVALAGVALAASAAGVVGTLTQASRARTERDFALRQLARAEAINELNSFLLSDAAPSGKPFTVNDLLERAERVLGRQQGGDPVTRVEVLISLGRQHTVQDDYAKARQILEEAYRLSRGLREDSIRAKASCALAQVASRSGDLRRGETLFQEGIRGIPDDARFVTDRFRCLMFGSEIAQNRGSAQEAIARAREAQLVLKRWPAHSELLDIDGGIVLAGAYSAIGRLQEACAAYEQAAARLAAVGRDDTQRAATVFNNWGNALFRMGHPLEAERALHRAVAAGRDGKGEQTVSPMVMVNYGRVLRELGRLDEAAGYVETGYAKAKQAGDRVALHQALSVLASTYREQGDLRRAGKMLDELEPMLGRDLPPGHIAFASLYQQRSLNALAQGDTAKALDLANRALAIAEGVAKTGRPGTDYVRALLIHRSTVEVKAGLMAQAAADANQALRLIGQVPRLSGFSSAAGRAYVILGQALQAEGKTAEARQAFRSAAEQLRNALGPDHAETRNAAALAGG